MALHARPPSTRPWLLAASIAVAIGLAMIAFAFASSSTGRDATGLPDAIETIAPEDGDEVLRQTRSVVDLPMATRAS